MEPSGTCAIAWSGVVIVLFSSSASHTRCADSMENVIITPHISGRNEDPINGQSIYEIFADNLHRFTHGQPLTHVVDRRNGY